MQLKLTWLNCFWLILPLLAWNLWLGSRITNARVNFRFPLAQATAHR